MAGKSCFLIGSHLSPDTLSPLLDEATERHIAEYRVTEFVVGRYGRFDQLAAEALRRAGQIAAGESGYLIASPGFGGSRTITDYALRREKRSLIQVTLLKAP